MTLLRFPEASVADTDSPLARDQKNQKLCFNGLPALVSYGETNRALT